VPFLASANSGSAHAHLSLHTRSTMRILSGADPDRWRCSPGLLDGFDVRVESTDWRIGPDQPELQRALIARIDADARGSPNGLEQIDRGRLDVVVGHQELLARPRARGWLG
jgi:hypothetical protein